MGDKQEQPQPKQIRVKDQVRILLKAFELAGIADRYEKGPNGTRIFVDNGNQTKDDPTLTHYIAIAEKKYIEANSHLILEDARFMLEKEIEEIKVMVNI